MTWFNMIYDAFTIYGISHVCVCVCVCVCVRVYTDIYTCLCVNIYVYMYMHACCVCAVPVMIPGFVSEELDQGVEVIDAVLHWGAGQTPSTLRRDLNTVREKRRKRGKGKRAGVDGEVVRW